VHNGTDLPRILLHAAEHEEPNMNDNTVRNDELRKMLTDRQREMQQEVQRRMRDGRADRSQDVRDEAEHSDAGIQGDIEFSLLQMRTR
jgi:hypothetical protein